MLNTTEEVRKWRRAFGAHLEDPTNDYCIGGDLAKEWLAELDEVLGQPSDPSAEQALRELLGTGSYAMGVLSVGGEEERRTAARLYQAQNNLTDALWGYRMICEEFEPQLVEQGA